MNSVTETSPSPTSHHYSSDDTWQDLLAGDDATKKEAREALFHRHINLAEGMAQKYIRITPAYKVDPEDIRSAAFEGLLYALDHFNPDEITAEASLDVSFRRYASRCVFGHLMTELTRQDTLTKNLREQVRQFRQQSEELCQLLGRAPTGDELRETLGCRNETRFQLMEALSDYRVNQEPLPHETGGQDEPDELADKLVTCAHAAAEGYDPVASDDPYEATELRMFQDNLQAAIETLPILDQQIVHVHYFMDETLTQIALDIGLARQTISQHHTRALAQLEQALVERGYGVDALPTEWGGC